MLWLFFRSATFENIKVLKSHGPLQTKHLKQLIDIRDLSKCWHSVEKTAKGNIVGQARSVCLHSGKQRCLGNRKYAKQKCHRASGAHWICSVDAAQERVSIIQTSRIRGFGLFESSLWLTLHAGFCACGPSSENESFLVGAWRRQQSYVWVIWSVDWMERRQLHFDNVAWLTLKNQLLSWHHCLKLKMKCLIAPKGNPRKSTAS